jgi:nucleoside-diphosphate-sugar epimerase
VPVRFHPATGPAVRVVAVTGAAGDVGRRVVRLLEGDPAVDRVVALDVARLPRGVGEKVEYHQVDVAASDIAALLRGADAVVHLAFVSDTERRRRRAAWVNVDGTRRVLDAAAEAGVPHIVALSAATVYGAWPNNPVPLTEEAPLRPNPEFAHAVQRAQAEQLIAEWVTAEPGRTAAVLRPVTALAEEGTSWLARAMAAAADVRAPDEDPPKQFVHLDDLASAVDLARRERLDGPFNVAPDGWVAGETVRALAGSRPRIALPPRFASWLSAMRWRFQRGPIPPGMLPYTQYPVLVANDLIVAAGWRPAWTNEEAFVAGTETKWWTMMSPKRKQELALGASAAVVGTVGLGVFFVIRRAVRRQRSSG